MTNGIFISNDGVSFKKDENNLVNFKHNKITISLNPESEDYKEIVFKAVKELLIRWNFTEKI